MIELCQCGHERNEHSNPYHDGCDVLDCRCPRFTPPVDEREKARGKAYIAYRNIHPSDDSIYNRQTFNAGYSARDKEVERLKDALASIRDMPDYDQDDEYRLRNIARRALEEKS